jgi:hypothetical protein
MKPTDWRTISEKDPKRLSKLIEAAFSLDTARKSLEKQAEALEKEVRAIKEHLIQKFDKSDLTEVKTSLGTARLSKKDVPTVDDSTGGWDAIYKYITKHKAWDLLQKRFGEKACQERWDAKVTIPGVKKFNKVDIKLGDAE